MMRDLQLGSLCRRPFEQLEIQWDGAVYACVPSWLPVQVGNVFASDLNEIWQSEALAKVRASVSDGSYSKCRSEKCPFLVWLSLAGGTNPRSPIVHNEGRDHSIYSGYFRGEAPGFPKLLSLSYDYSCGRRCEMCRSGVRRIQPGSADDERAVRITESVLRYLPNLEYLKIGGNGEPFESAHYLSILNSLTRNSHPRLKLRISTNGLGLTKKVLDDLLDRGDFLDALEIGIDAANAVTYEEVRSKCSFSELLENLGPISKARRTGRIQRFTFSFVVQRANFREMNAFVEMGRNYGVDAVLFNLLDDWQVMGSAQFQKAAVHLPGHPEHLELRKHLRNPVFSSDFVQLGALAALRAASVD